MTDPLESTTYHGMPFARARIIWVIIACLAWQYGVLNESRGIARESLPALLLVMLSFAVGLGALVVALSEKAVKWLEGYRLFGLFTFFFVAFGIIDAITRSRSPYMFTTDAHAYMDYAARLVSAGKNPYDSSLYGAIVSTRVPIELQTPLDNGGLSDRLAYPSLSVLYLIPFVKLGIPTTIAYALAFYGCLVIIFKVAPVDLRPLVLIPFFADETYLSFCFGGITDTPWALLLCLVVVTWRRPNLAAFFFGLACSYKQHAWLLAPFVMVRIAREVPRGERLRAFGRFFGIVAFTFFVLNLPFALWSPRAWFTGVVEPLATAMVPMGEGVSGFLVFAGAGVPKVFFTLAFWGFFALLLLVCATWRAGKVFMWIAPSVAFFLNYRSLSSYWYFNLLPFMVELAQREAGSAKAPSEEAPPPLFDVPWRRLNVPIAITAVMLVAAGVIASCRRNAEVDVAITEPLRTWTNYVYRIDLQLTNHGTTTVTPRFWVQGTNFQPLPWHADGPPELGPGATAAYSINALSSISQFDIARGARLTISDLSTSLRKSVEIAPDEAELSPRAVPNASFRFWDVNGGAPTYWKLAQRGSPGASASPVRNDPHHAVTLSLEPDAAKRERELIEFCGAIPSCYAATGSSGRFVAGDVGASDHRVELGTDFAAHEGAIAIWAHTPKDANVGPALDDRYGVQLWFGNRPVTLLLGGEAGAGKLPDGSPYEILPGPRETWTRFSIDLGDLKRRFAPNAYPQRYLLKRFPLIEIPVIPVRFLLTYASRVDVPKTAMFGAIEDTMHGKDRIEDVIAEMDKHPGAVDAWRSRYEHQLKNPGRANQYLDRARRLEEHPELDLEAAGAALGSGRTADAERMFTKLLPIVPVDAHLGLGWTLMRQAKGEEARSHFEAALAEVAKSTAGRKMEGDEELQKLGAMLGLADAYGLLGDCAGAWRTLRDVPQAERDVHVNTAPELVKCK